MACGKCGLQWDVKDPDGRPACNPDPDELVGWWREYRREAARQYALKEIAKMRLR
jgi:hypothetical protein